MESCTLAEGAGTSHREGQVVGYTLRVSSGRIRSKAAGRASEAEDFLIGRIAKKLGATGQSSTQLRCGIGDDAALWKAHAGYEVILTCDWFLEGVHFLRDAHPADSVGWKCLARAVSDVAAMGGTPRCFLLSLALPKTHTGRWLSEFLGGLRKASRKLRCTAAGGDTTRHEKILISVTVIGEVKTGRAVLRSGARTGDLICVSGRLGGAQFGLELLKHKKRAAGGRYPALAKHLYPLPRLKVGRTVAETELASAMMDLSDGLSSDLPRLCKASGVGARIYESKLPLVNVSGRQQKAQDARRLRAALHGGDDYELLFTVPKKKADLLRRKIAGAPVTVIGEIHGQNKILLVKKDGRQEPLEIAGWDPFRDPAIPR